MPVPQYGAGADQRQAPLSMVWSIPGVKRSSGWEEAARHCDEQGLAALILMIATTSLFNRLNATTRQVAGSMDLRGRIALVTGASSGIMYATALRLAEAGADLAIGYGHKEQAAQVLAEHIHQMGLRAGALRGDLRKPPLVLPLWPCYCSCVTAAIKRNIGRRVSSCHAGCVSSSSGVGCGSESFVRVKPESSNVFTEVATVR